MRTLIPVLFAVFMSCVPPAATQKSSTTRIRACGELPSAEKWIRQGSHGLQFRVPKEGFKVSGGDVDVDYVRFVITQGDHDGILEFWFGSMALGPEPRPTLVKASIAVTRTTLLNSDGARIGGDTRGEKLDHTRWRHFAVGSEGAVYEDVSPFPGILSANGIFRQLQIRDCSNLPSF
jgi:hypothetical protein